jgi:hypothetical protein
VGTNSGGVTTTTITNNTLYTLYFYLSGPFSRSLTIAPGASENVQLQPGHYEEAARVAGPSVVPFYGVQDYRSGTAYSETFYIMTQQH